MSKLGYLIVLISYFWPMALVGAAGLWGDWEKFWVAIAFVAASSLASVAIHFFLLSRRGEKPFSVSSHQPQDKDVLSYVVSFIPAFIITEITTASGYISFIVFSILFVLSLFLTKSYFTNIFLLLCGWRIYSAQVAFGGSVASHAFLIARASKKLNKPIEKLVRIGVTNFYVVQ